MVLSTKNKVQGTSFNVECEACPLFFSVMIICPSEKSDESEQSSTNVRCVLIKLQMAQMNTDAFSLFTFIF